MRYIQDPKTLKLVPAGEYYATTPPGNVIPGIIPDITPCISPVDGSHITSRSRLREHNRQHGVTDIREYGPGWFERKWKERSREMTGQTSSAACERRELINEVLKQKGH